MIDYGYVPKFIYQDAVKRGYRVAEGGGGCEDYQTCEHPVCVKSFDMETGEVIAGDALLHNYIHADYLFDLYESLRVARKASDAAVSDKFWSDLAEEVDR